MESSSRRACSAAGRPLASPPLGRRVESSSRRACSAAGRPLAPPPLRRATAEQPSRGARAGRVVRRSKPRSQSPLAQSRPRVRDASRDEGSVGGSGAADGAIRPAKSRRRDDRPHLAPITWSQCPPSRQRPPEITEIASSSRDEGSVGGGGAVRAPHASPRSRRRDDRH